MIYLNMQCEKITIIDICNVERAIPGKIYKAGSCYIKLSAVDEFVGQLKEPGEIDSRHAVLEPKKELNTAYLYIAIEQKFPEFLRRYRTTINLQFDALNHFEICWHKDKRAQEYVVSMISTIDREVDLIESQIAQEEELKRWYLKKLLI